MEALIYIPLSFTLVLCTYHYLRMQQNKHAAATQAKHKTKTTDAAEQAKSYNACLKIIQMTQTVNNSTSFAELFAHELNFDEILNKT